MNETTARRQIVGIEFDVIPRDNLLLRIMSAVEKREKIDIGYCNLHTAFIASREPIIDNFQKKCSIFYVDGMAIIFLRWLLWRDVRRIHRHTLSQFFPSLLQMLADQGANIYYIGSEDKIVSDAVNVLKSKIPNLKMSYSNGFFDQDVNSPETQEIIDKVNSLRSDVVFVGLGQPRQEKWMMEIREKIDAPVVYACGGAIEYFSTNALTPPHWVSNNGLEFLFRFFLSPRRLFSRYFVEPLYLIPIFYRDLKARLQTH